jgi:hypothetical protein
VLHTAAYALVWHKDLFLDEAQGLLVFEFIQGWYSTRRLSQARLPESGGVRSDHSAGPAAAA